VHGGGGDRHWHMDPHGWRQQAYGSLNLGQGEARVVRHDSRQPTRGGGGGDGFIAIWVGDLCPSERCYAYLHARTPFQLCSVG
jgi:hypothetical protein